MPFTETSRLIPLPENDQELIPAHRLSVYIGIAAQTLARWRSEGQGPAFVKLGHRVAYRTGDVRQWLAKRTLASTVAATARL